jgi:hypothetical protein
VARQAAQRLLVGWPGTPGLVRWSRIWEGSFQVLGSRRRSRCAGAASSRSEVGITSLSLAMAGCGWLTGR